MFSDMNRQTKETKNFKHFVHLQLQTLYSQSALATIFTNITNWACSLGLTLHVFFFVPFFSLVCAHLTSINYGFFISVSLSVCVCVCVYWLITIVTWMCCGVRGHWCSHWVSVTRSLGTACWIYAPAVIF